MNCRITKTKRGWRWHVTYCDGERRRSCILFVTAADCAASLSVWLSKYEE